MNPDTGEIPFVEFEYDVLNASLTAEGNALGRITHDGVAYRILMRPVKIGSDFWSALETISRSGRLKIIAFRLAPAQGNLTTAYEITTGDIRLDLAALQGLLAEIPGSGVQLITSQS